MWTCTDAPKRTSPNLVQGHVHDSWFWTRIKFGSFLVSSNFLLSHHQALEQSQLLPLRSDNTFHPLHLSLCPCGNMPGNACIPENGGQNGTRHHRSFATRSASSWCNQAETLLGRWLASEDTCFTARSNLFTEAESVS